MGRKNYYIVKLSILEYIEFSLLLNKTENVLEIKILKGRYKK